jgi:hypothetical protein
MALGVKRWKAMDVDCQMDAIMDRALYVVVKTGLGSMIKTAAALGSVRSAIRNLVAA